MKATGITDFRFHDTRHTAATRITRATGNLKVAQKLLGHTEIGTTARYAHVQHEDVLNGLKAVEAASKKETAELSPRKSPHSEVADGGQPIDKAI